MSFQLYVVDTETTGLSYIDHSPVEISIYRMSDNSQKTWFLKPINPDNIEADAARVNGYNIDDLRGLTKVGREKYLNPNKVLIDIEDWLNEDMCTSSHRVMVGQNVGFDKNMLQELWRKCEKQETFPFSEKYTIDTMCIEFFMNFCQGNIGEAYSLSALTKKYGVKNEKAHTAESDVLATLGVFTKQVDFFKKFLKNE